MSNGRSRRGGFGTGLRVFARQLRADSAVVATTIVAVLLCGLFLTTSPLLFDQLADQALEQTVSSAEPQLRNISAALDGQLRGGPDDDPFRRIRERGESFESSEIPSSVQTTVEERTWVADSPQFFVAAMPGSDTRVQYSSGRYAATLMTMRYQSDIEGRAELTRGALPRSREPVEIELGEDCPLSAQPNDDEELDCQVKTVPVFEVAVTQATLDFLPIEVGGQLLLSPDLRDTAFLGLAREDLQYHLVLEVSGLIELEDLENEYWFNDPRLHRPRLRSNADFTFVFATSLMASEDYGRLLRETTDARWGYGWRYFVAADQITEDTARTLAADLANLQEQNRASAILGPDRIVVNTKLPTLLSQYFERRDVTRAVMSTSVIGLLVLTSALVLVISAVMAERQRSGLRLLLDRGASRRQIVTTRAMQGLALLAPPAGLALGLAHLTIPGSLLAPTRLAIALVVLGTLSFVLALGTMRSSQSVPGRSGAGRSSGWVSARTSSELFVAIIAIGSVVVIRRRGLVGVEGEQPDLLLAITPTLVACAAGLLVVRAYPLLMRLFAAAGSRRRGLTAFVGFRRVVAQPSSSRLPLLVMLMALSLASFAYVSRTSIQHAQREVTWHEAGAPYRLDERDLANPLSGSLNPDVLDSHEAHAFGIRFTDAPTREQPGVPPVLDVLLIDSRGYTAVNEGTLAAPHFPSFMLDPADRRKGTQNDPIPAIATDAGTGSPAPGDVLLVDLNGSPVHLIVREVRSRFPTMPLDRLSLIADIDTVDALDDGRPSDPTVLFIRADDDANDEISELARTQTLSSQVTSQAARMEQLREDRFTAGLDRTLLLAVALSLAVAAVSGVALLAQSSKSRERDFAFLRAQGLSQRQGGWLRMIEHVPGVIMAVVVAVPLGVAIRVALEPALDLSAFTGTALEAGTAVDTKTLILAATVVLVGLLGVTNRIGRANDKPHVNGRVDELENR